MQNVQPEQRDSELQLQQKQRDSLLLLLVYFSLPLPPASSDPCHVIFVTLSPCEKYPVGGQPRIEKQGVALHFVKYQVDKQPLEALARGKRFYFLFVYLFWFDLICSFYSRPFCLISSTSAWNLLFATSFILLTCFWIQFDLCVWGEKRNCHRFFSACRQFCIWLHSCHTNDMLFAEACIGVCVFLYAKFEMLGKLCVLVADTHSCVYACILKGYTFTCLVLAHQPVTRKAFVFVRTQCFYIILCQSDY